MFVTFVATRGFNALEVDIAEAAAALDTTSGKTFEEVTDALTAADTSSASVAFAAAMAEAAAAAATADASSSVPEIWTETTGAALAGNSTGWAGNFRQHVQAANVSTSGNRARVTFKGGTGENASVGAAYIGHGAASGDPYDFEATPVQLMVGGSGSFTVPAATEVVSDSAVFSLDETKPLVISVFFNNGAADNVATASPGFGTAYFKPGATSEAATINVTGYNTSGGINGGFRFVRKVEVRTV
jgi:hypothetical protein